MSSEPVSSNWLSAGVRSTGHRSQPSPNLVSHSKQLRTFFGSGVVIACRAVPDGVNLRQKGSVKNGAKLRAAWDDFDGDVF